jgi:hypothetical protein
MSDQTIAGKRDIPCEMNPSPDGDGQTQRFL